MAIYFDPRTGQYVQVTPGGQKTTLKMQTNVTTSQAPGTTGGTTAPGATPPPAQPPAGGAGGAAGTGGGGTVNTQGGNISQGAIYGGSVTNTASGGTGSLDASGGSNNVYRETTAAPAAGPTGTPPAGPENPSGACPEGQFPDDETGECRSLPPCGDGPPCPMGKMCSNGKCVDVPTQPSGEVQSFQRFVSSRTNPSNVGGYIPPTNSRMAQPTPIPPNPPAYMKR